MSVTLYRRGVDSSISSDFQALDTLQRQYRAMEYSRKDPKGEENSSTIVRVQRHLIDKLKRDRDRLKSELSMETRQAKLVNNHYEAGNIVRLQDQGDLYSKLIESEKRKLEDADKSAQRLSKAIGEHRRETGGINAAREANNATQKQIKILENRLDKALVKLNESLANNKNLRFHIDNLRRERFVFDGIYKKLEKEVADKKEKMNAILAGSQQAVQQKQAAQEDLLTMKARADQEQNAFEYKWNELGQLIHEDRAIKENLRYKEQMRALKLFGGSCVLDASDAVKAGHEEEESRARKKLAKHTWLLNKEKESIVDNQKRVGDYEASFAAIQKATKMNDLDELVKVFVTAEDNNFTLFNYVNELSAQISQAEEAIHTLEEAINSFQTSAAPDHQRSAMLSDLSAQISHTQYSSGQLQMKYQGSLKMIQTLKEGIVNIYQQLACEQMESHKKLVELFGNLKQEQEQQDGQDESADEQSQSQDDVSGGGGASGGHRLKSHSSMRSIPQYYGLTETNLLKYLGIIEVRANELLKSYVKTREEENREEEAIDQERRAMAELERRVKAIEAELNLEEENEEVEEEEEDELRKAALQLSITDPQELRKKMAGSKYYRRKNSVFASNGGSAGASGVNGEELKNEARRVEKEARGEPASSYSSSSPSSSAPRLTLSVSDLPAQRGADPHELSPEPIVAQEVNEEQRM